MHLFFFLLTRLLMYLFTMHLLDAYLSGLAKRSAHWLRTNTPASAAFTKAIALLSAHTAESSGPPPGFKTPSTSPMASNHSPSTHNTNPIFSATKVRMSKARAEDAADSRLCGCACFRSTNWFGRLLRRVDAHRSDVDCRRVLEKFERERTSFCC